MPKRPSLWTLKITCAPPQADAIGACLEADSLAVSIHCPPRTRTALVEALRQGKPNKEEWQTKLALLAKSLAPKGKTLNLKLEIVPVGNLDWIKKVSEDFPPLPVARWTVFGAAHKSKVKNKALGLQIDATSAFGTGEHPTTKGCLILLDQFLTQNPQAQKGTLLDMGCGSGILAMAFAKATQGKALGVDMDAPSVKIARANARINGVAGRMRFIVSEGYASPLVREKGPYDLIMANIFADPLCAMAKDLKRNLKPGGYAILSGLLNCQAKAVIAAHEKQGLFLVKRLKLGEWSALALRRPLRASCKT